MRPNPGIFGIFPGRGIENWKALWSFARLMQGHLQNFGEMERMAIGLLRDLLAATETIGDDEPVGRSAADGGKKFKFADGFRNVVFVFFKSKSSRHSAASRSRRGEIDAHALQHSFFGRHFHDCLVMAMPVDQRAPLQFGNLEIWRALFEKFAKQKYLLRQSLRALIFREQIGEFIAEDSRTAWLEHNDRRPSLDLGQKLIHDLKKQALGAVEHANVVKGTPAAKMSTGHANFEAGGF